MGTSTVLVHPAAAAAATSTPAPRPATVLLNAVRSEGQIRGPRQGCIPAQGDRHHTLLGAPLLLPEH
jgi:hypothetical protein